MGRFVLIFGYLDGEYLDEVLAEESRRGGGGSEGDIGEMCFCLAEGMFCAWGWRDAGRGMRKRVRDIYEYEQWG